LYGFVSFRFDLLHLVHHVHPLDHASKDNVLAVEVLRFSEGDEEL